MSDKRDPDGSTPRFGGGDGRSVEHLSDEELAKEVLRRRTARKNRVPGGQRALGRRGSDGALAQYYRNLELDPGASMEEVRSAYRRLMGKYHPSRHKGDEKKERLAERLRERLDEAYRALLKSF